MQRIFVLGASGYIGSAIARRFVDEGCKVIGLSRSDDSDAKLDRIGVTPVRGDVTTLAAIGEAAAAADAVIYAARYTPDEIPALEAVVEALRGTDRRFLFTSGASLIAETTAGEASPHRFAEDAPFTAPRESARRLDSEVVVRGAANLGVGGMAIRPPLVYGHGGSAQIPQFAGSGTRTGTVRHVGPGKNHWGFIHLDELAEMFVRLLGRGAPGAVYHAVAGEVEMGEVAATVAKTLGLPVGPWTLPEAEEGYGKFVARLTLGSSCRPIGKRAADLGWSPTRSDILEDIAQGSYRDAWREQAP